MATKIAQLEDRLRKIEAEMLEVKQAIAQDNSKSWLRQAAGQFKDDPVFDEIVRLGKEIRDKEQGSRRVTPKRTIRRKGT
jgi:hypothetical protein